MSKLFIQEYLCQRPEVLKPNCQISKSIFKEFFFVSKDFLTLMLGSPSKTITIVFSGHAPSQNAWAQVVSVQVGWQGLRLIALSDKPPAL